VIGPHDVVLDGVHVHLRKGTEQVVTVNRTHGYHARVTLWRLTNGTWQARFATADGRIGYGGLARGQHRVQGSGTTPLGSYRLTYVFGFEAPRPGWEMRYRSVEPGDFWVEDNGSPYYNRYRNQAQGGFRWWLPAGAEDGSERLTDYRRQYDLAVVTDYNHAQVRHRGAGIFLHVNGRGATAGCVSAPHRFLQRTVGALDPAYAPVIAIGR
jgi:L,D-peptidoglycan transpeptidase YkuD (ErfK/YbiS/YcfS/YnhG family)